MISITKKTYSRFTTAKSNRTIKYIVIHYTAGITSKAGSAASTAYYFGKTSTRDASADFIVDDATIVQYNPDIKNRYTHHCGGSKYKNSKGGSLYGVCTSANSIGIEVCSTNSAKKITNPNDQYWSFTDAVLTNARDLVLYLMKTYNIPASNVIRHYDVNGKDCPGIAGWNANSGSEAKWNAFKTSLSSGNTTTSTTSAASSSSTANGYKVRVTSTTLKVREKPSASAKITAVLNKNEVYTIVGISNGWGQLKSGAGWINLNYTKVV